MDMGNVVVCRSPLVDPLPSSQSPATSTPSGTSDSSGNTRAGPAVRARAASLGDGGHGAPACEREGGQGPFDLAAPDSDDRKLQQRAARCDEMVRALVRALRVALACMSRLWRARWVRWSRVKHALTPAGMHPCQHMRARTNAAGQGLGNSRARHQRGTEVPRFWYLQDNVGGGQEMPKEVRIRESIQASLPGDI